MKSISKTDRKLIARLQSQLDELRQRSGISERGEILFQADLNRCDDDVVLVEADGLGGAVLLVVEGNYPVDYLIRDERRFSTESEAEKAATRICGYDA